MFLTTVCKHLVVCEHQIFNYFEHSNILNTLCYRSKILKKKQKNNINPNGFIIFRL